MTDSPDAGAGSTRGPETAATAVAAPDTTRVVAPRLWPGFLAFAVIMLALTVPGALLPESPLGFGPLFAGLVGGYAATLVWWAYFSRIPWRDRVIGLVSVAAAVTLGVGLGFHETIRGKNAVIPLGFFLMPWLVGGVLLTLAATRPFGWAVARLATLAVASSCVLVFAAVRYEGGDSAFSPKFLARWQPSSEERLLAELGEQRAPPEPAGEIYDVAAGPDDWPGFRGPGRNGHVRPGSLGGDWSSTQPRELWRTAVGPGWGSLCVVGDRLFTQEQRGDHECVVAYDADSGQQLWENRVDDRFYESVAGAGPRATPSYHAGRLYTLGAEGAFQCLEAGTGDRVWRRRLIADHRGDDGGPAAAQSPRLPLTNLVAPPAWGFASSPLIVSSDDGPTLAIVLSNAPKSSDSRPDGDGAVVAVDAATGEAVWKSGVGDHSYSSPHLATLGGDQQVLVVSNLGLESLDPATGSRLWLFEWDIEQFPRSIQPTVVGDERVVLSAGYDSGTMLINVRKKGGQWTAEPAWPRPCRSLEPYFNDMVAHHGYLYGIHKKRLTCVSLDTGAPAWPRRVKRRSKFGNGQLVLDPQAGVLLLTTETTGEVVLVEATPEDLNVLHRFVALPADTTWNHPVVAGGRLFVRNGAEAACYLLPALLEE